MEIIQNPHIHSENTKIHVKQWQMIENILLLVRSTRYFQVWWVHLIFLFLGSRIDFKRLYYSHINKQGSLQNFFLHKLHNFSRFWSKPDLDPRKWIFSRFWHTGILFPPQVLDRSVLKRRGQSEIDNNRLSWPSQLWKDLTRSHLWVITWRTLETKWSQKR